MTPSRPVPIDQLPQSVANLWDHALEQHAKAIAFDRLIMSLMLEVARGSPDPLAACHRIREAALSNLSMDTEGFERAHQEADRMLNKVETACAKYGPLPKG